jgi:hypothetical protein
LILNDYFIAMVSAHASAHAELRKVSSADRHQFGIGVASSNRTAPTSTLGKLPTLQNFWLS